MGYFGITVMGSNKSGWLLYIPILVLGAYLLIRLIDQSKIMWFFPLDTTNDMSSYMAQFYFLLKCGYHNLCPYWYNGFIAFELTPPGWYFFALPIYWLTKDIQVTFYISLIVIYVLAFLGIFLIGRLLKFSILQRLLFFLLFFGNAIAIGNFIRLGRVPELFAWLNFLIIGLAVLYYKDKPIGLSFFWLIPPLSIVILSHQTVAILAGIMIMSLFFIKHSAERIKIALCALLPLGLTSFWWLPYLKSFGGSAGVGLVLTETLLRFDRAYIAQTLAAFIIPVILWLVFYMYWKSNNRPLKDLVFFSLPLLLSLLFFTRLIILIPLLKYIYPDVYMLYFLFFALFLFLKTDFSLFGKRIILLAHIMLILFAVASVAVNALHTPGFITPGESVQEVLSLLGRGNGTFLLIGATPSTLYANAVYSYAPIYHGLFTSGGWYTTLITPEYYNHLVSINNYLDEADCGSLISTANFLNTSYLITLNNYCSTLGACGLSYIDKNSNACLYGVKQNV